MTHRAVDNSPQRTAIREANAEDLRGLLQVYRESGLDPGTNLSLSEGAAILERIRHYPNYKVFVAETDGHIVGTFALLIMDNLGHGGTPSGLVEAVGVLPPFQGKGIGKEMMQFAMNRCKEHGCYKMMLSSNETRTDAHRFYESLGFTRHGFSFLVEL
jgi:GNAT superfamily N-acetyltransferase